MEDALPALQLEEMEPNRQPARLPIVEAAAGVDRDEDVAIQLVRVTSRPVPRMVPSPCDTGRQPLPHGGRRYAADQHGGGPRKSSRRIRAKADTKVSDRRM